MRSPKTLYWAMVVVIVFAAIASSAAIGNPAILSAQTEEPSEFQESDVSDDAAFGRTVIEPDSFETEGVKTGNPSIHVDVQRQLNDFRRELLDDRADTIDWWLAAVAFFVTLFGVGAAIAGYISFNRFREIEVEAGQSARESEEYSREAHRLVEEIRKYRDQSESHLLGMRERTSQDVGDPEKGEETAAAALQVQSNPDASPLDKAIANAQLLQQAGEVSKAIEKWRAIAMVAEGSDDGLAARAWLSVGFLLQEGEYGEV